MPAFSIALMMNGVRVSCTRVEPSQGEQVDRERYEPEREPLEHVSRDRRIARIEATPHQDGNRRLREDGERDGRRYDDQQQVAEAEREVVAHPLFVAG